MEKEKPIIKSIRFKRKENYDFLLNEKKKSKYSWEEFLISSVRGAENISSQSASEVPKMYYKSNTNVIQKFTPPTVEEVKEYCSSRNNQINPQAFIDFYESKGWMIGKNKMKDWRAAIRTWEKNHRPQVPKNIIINDPTL